MFVSPQHPLLGVLEKMIKLPPGDQEGHLS
jgi:hypothetical protein